MSSDLFCEILQRRLSRRGFVQSAAVLGAATLAPQALKAGSALSSTSLGFAEVARGLTPEHALAEGYRAQILLRWGDALFEDSPPFNPASGTPEGQARQFGYNNDHIQYFPLHGSQHGLLCVNHEFSVVELAFPGGRLPEALSRLEHLTDMQMHGVSVVEIKRQGRDWQMVPGRFNRRITASTPMRIQGPAAGHARMQTKADPSGTNAIGTFANCAGGKTPWGTYLTCEENVDMFFYMGGYDGPELANHRRMLVGEQLFHRWDQVDPRFDVSQEPHEPNRFGWVVEIDPFHPGSTPIKRTALGRFKHESASCVISADGHLVVYSGDDEVFQHLYRYVSAGRYVPGNAAHNAKLLDEGTLYAARFDEEGVEWLPLINGQNGLDASNGFSSQGEVLIETRRAAELVGATKMDRPEDVEISPQTGRVYVAMTKNFKRESADAVNRRAPDPAGYVVEILPPVAANGKAEHSATRMQWEMFLQGGNPHEASGSLYGAMPSDRGWLTCPDNFAFDAKGRLWITTDGQEDVAGFADALYATEVKGPQRAVPKAFFRGPVGCEVTGPCFTPDGKTLFVSVQHPGQGTGSTYEQPSTRWPDFNPDMPPRPALLAITKDDGGLIGE